MDLEKIELVYDGIKHSEIKDVSNFLESLPVDVVSSDTTISLRVRSWGTHCYHIMPQSNQSIEYHGLENLANEVDCKVSLKTDYRGPHLYIEKKSSRDTISFLLYTKYSSG